MLGLLASGQAVYWKNCRKSNLNFDQFRNNVFLILQKHAHKNVVQNRNLKVPLFLSLNLYNALLIITRILETKNQT
jgi:hypothetical protein